MAGDPAADQRAQDKAEQHVQRADAANRAALAQANNRQNDQVDEHAAGHRLVQLERLIGKIAAEEKMQAASDLVEVNHEGISSARGRKPRITRITRMNVKNYNEGRKACLALFVIGIIRVIRGFFRTCLTEMSFAEYAKKRDQ